MPKKIKTLKLLSAAVLLGSVASPAFTHEMRHVCKSFAGISGLACEGSNSVPNTFMIHTGFINEPAWTGDTNGINLNFSFHPDAAHTITEDVDTSKSDTVHLDFANIQYYVEKKGKLVKKDWTKVYPTDQNAPDPKTGNVKKVWGKNNVYNIYFKPTKSGIYGFHVKGTLVHNGITQPFEETFICGDLGTKSTDGTKFNCVEDEITFPTEDHKGGKGSDS